MSKLLDDQTTYDRILAYLEDINGEHNDLTDHEKILAKRYIDIYNFYRDTKSRTDSVAKLMKVHNISRPQAYRDFATAVSLFGDAAKMSINSVRFLMTEVYLEAINMARQMRKPGIMAITADKLGKAWNVQNPMEEAMKEMEPHTYILNLDQQSLLAMNKMMGTGNINFADFLNNLPIQDADYTELPDESEGAGNKESNP
ncbi:MAG TPA: hypothetical protein VGB63_13090 [Pedobacter sp.]|jgi:hypothetical protein